MAIQVCGERERERATPGFLAALWLSSLSSSWNYLTHAASTLTGQSYVVAAVAIMTVEMGRETDLEIFGGKREGREALERSRSDGVPLLIKQRRNDDRDDSFLSHLLNRG